MRLSEPAFCVAVQHSKLILSVSPPSVDVRLSAGGSNAMPRAARRSGGTMTRHQSYDGGFCGLARSNHQRARAAQIVAAAIGSMIVVPVVRAGPVLSTLVQFNGSNGSEPSGTLAIDAVGDLYGTTTQGNFGSAIANGTVFELKVGNLTTVDTLASFNSSNGSRPQGAIAIDPAGDVYGTTNSGGSTTRGVVFAVPAGTGTINDLAAFTGNAGANPDGGVTADGHGNLYGTTTQAGGAGLGTVFSVPVTGTSSDPSVVRFNTSSGGEPTGRLAIDAAGNVYGTTSGIGTSTNGTVFEIASGTGTFTTLATFNGSNGQNPGDLTVDSAGNLYGTTSIGGNSSDGAVFEVKANSGMITLLASFTGYNGGTPKAGVIVDSAGDIFGTTESGGGTGGIGQVTGDGTVYEVAAGSGTITTLAAFNGPNGANPFGGLVADSSGNLYGTTNGGGNNSEGIVFEVTGSGYVTGGSQAITVAAGQTYHFTVNAGTGILVRTIPGVTIAATGVAIADPAGNHTNRQLIVINGTGLSMAGSTSNWTATFDLGHNDLDLAGASLAMITGQLAQGYAHGTWTGPGGITSAVAAADTAHLTALGAIQNNQSGTAVYTAVNLFDTTTPGIADILVKYTYYGDANLDGKVDGSDYSLIDAGYTSRGGKTGWYNGDFNYDGVIDGSDYSLIDNAFNDQSVNLSMAGLVASQTAPPAAVPEPAALAGVCIVTVGLISGRRRRWTVQ
jgi:uncharacterized repeat protein (TIGR03803 family)